MKLKKEEIRGIDEFLIRHRVKYIDVRIELIDHLASEYETETQEEKLHAFLMRKRDFIKVFIKERQKKIHWSYQKQLWSRFFKFFYAPKALLITICLLGLIYFSILELNKTAVKYLFLATLFIPNMAALFIHFKQNKLFKKVQSAQSVFAIMSLPSLFLYCLSPVEDIIQSNTYYLAAYWFFAVLFNISGLIEVYHKKSEIVKKYKSVTIS